MLSFLKEYLRRKTGVSGNRGELKDLETRLQARIDYLAAFMNLTWPEILHLDEEVLKKATKKLRKDFDFKDLKHAIHKNDLMFAFHVNRHKYELSEAIYSYFKVGLSTTYNLKQLVQTQTDSPTKILDFGSGYGRVSRFLPDAFPQARISVSEVKPQALKFQQDQFGFEVLEHNENPGSLKDQRFDLILALSVFTHLPQRLFEGWMFRLIESLEPGGILVLTYLDQASSDMAEIMQRTTTDRGEFIYIQQSEDKHFSFVADSISNDEEYGSSFITRSYLEKLVIHRCKSIDFIDRKLVKGQDAAMIIV